MGRAWAVLASPGARRLRPDGNSEMKLLVTILVALVLLAVETALLPAFGFSIARFDVSVAVVMFLVVRAQTLEGAVGSFFAGYFLDVLSGQPTGLYAFTAVLMFLIGRIFAPLADVRSAVAFVPLVFVADLLHNLLTWMLVSLATPEGISRSAMLGGLFATAALTALVAAPIWLLLARLEKALTKPETGLLR